MTADDAAPPLTLTLTVAEVFGPTPAGDDPLLSELAGVAMACAEAASLILVEGLEGSPQSVDTKSSATDMVSAVDHRAEAVISRILSERRPDDGVLGEEGTARPGSTDVRWVVDPLDGTTNYLFGIPQFAVSVAAEVSGTTVVGIVMDPSKRETWAAVQGWGARCNGAPARVATGRSTLATALVATGFGSAALDLCWTAGGRYDAYYEWGLNPWDLAAGALICAEAGGRVEAFPGRLIVATTPELFGPFCDLLASAGATDIPPGPEPKFW